MLESAWDRHILVDEVVAHVLRDLDSYQLLILVREDLLVDWLLFA